MKNLIKNFLGISELERKITEQIKTSIFMETRLEKRISNLENEAPFSPKGEYIKVDENRLICLEVKFDKNVPLGYDEVIRKENIIIGKVPIYEVPNVVYGGNWVEITNKKEREFFLKIFNQK